LVEGNLHVTLCREVVDFIGPNGLDQPVKTARVGHVAVMKYEARTFGVTGVGVLKVIDSPAVH
jgi:hypothetical protein